MARKVNLGGGTQPFKVTNAEDNSSSRIPSISRMPQELPIVSSPNSKQTFK